MERYYQPEIETASREQIKAWQDERLVKQVRNVWDNVPYYRKKMEEKGLVNDQPGQGKLDIFTTGSTEEYTMKAAKVGLDPVTSVQFYPPMKL